MSASGEGLVRMIRWHAAEDGATTAVGMNLAEKLEGGGITSSSLGLTADRPWGKQGEF